MGGDGKMNNATPCVRHYKEHVQEPSGQLRSQRACSRKFKRKCRRLQGKANTLIWLWLSASHSIGFRPSRPVPFVGLAHLLKLPGANSGLQNTNKSSRYGIGTQNFSIRLTRQNKAVRGVSD